MPAMSETDTDKHAQSLAEALQIEQQQERADQKAEVERDADIDSRIAEALSHRDPDPT